LARARRLACVAQRFSFDQGLRCGPDSGP
jgi:hypothetical protein